MRCTSTKKVIGGDQKRHEIQCNKDWPHESWHRGELFNSQGTYRKTDVHLWPQSKEEKELAQATRAGT